VLLAGSGFLLRALHHLLQEERGFKAEHVLTLQTALSGAEPTGRDLVAAVYGPELDRPTHVPGVRAAGFVTYLPLSNGHTGVGFSIAGRPNPNPGNGPMASLNAASEDYFSALRIPLLQGRLFSSSDAPGKQRVAIINDVLARRYFPAADPVGKQIAFLDPDSQKLRSQSSG
jgi:hypothetical protein